MSVCSALQLYCIHFSPPLSRPHKRKPDDLNPLKCISYIHEEYIRPICEQSGLRGLCYAAGPVVDVCTGAPPPHSTGVLAAVCYQGSGSTDIETLVCKCGTCGEEYDINDVLRTGMYFWSDVNCICILTFPQFMNKKDGQCICGYDNLDIAAFNSTILEN